MNSKESMYTWHLSLRVDRPVEGCTIRPHAYMYGKKLDERDIDKAMPPHTKKCREPPPNHEFSYRWYRGPHREPCAYESCPRRTSFSPHDWSMHALGGSGCSLQCVSSQSSLYKAIFCNSNCFIQGWKTQYTVPKDGQQQNRLGWNGGSGGSTPGGQGSTTNTASTPTHRRTLSSAASDVGSAIDDDARSVGSTSSYDSNFGRNRNKFNNNMYSDDASTHSAMSSSNTNTPGTPKGYVGGYQSFQPYDMTGIGNTTDLTEYNPSQQGGVGEEWVEISRDQLYIPNTDDIGRNLKVEAGAYSVDTGELLMHRVVKTNLVLSRAPEPAKRNLVTTKNNGNGGNGNGARFRIVTYNVLAEIYATQQQYPHCDFWALSWDYRFQNILREIIEVCPDVICLQEVQADHYETHIYTSLSDAGFEGVYKQKTRVSMGLAGKVDGCALFWRRTKFHLVESYSIEFNELAQRQASQVLGMNPRSEEGAAYLNRLLKDNVAQLVVLELAQPQQQNQQQNQNQQQGQNQGGQGGQGGQSGQGGQGGGGQSGGRSGHREIMNQVCIANTHLYSNKEYPDVKLWQSWQLLQELETFVLSRGTNLPLMICGDFNSTPDTAVYDLLSRQAVHPGHPDVNVSGNNNNGGEDTPNILPDPMSITHSFQLGSVYQTVLGEEPKHTNFTTSFKGVLDYMWYSAQNLRPLSAAPVPEAELLTANGEALPSTEYSSDHIMLISDMQIISGGTRPP